ncbi:ABC transporter substrate-binding protein [Aneurinibacillus sp. Ricciae_BoGa-3]|uniref:ABC transporter substrate-binding protein n=1 Tax=Aneurinibacillus sp. Ricciae_BoGa-3 TaxID=3022697 RepID=UPI0023413302|nr:ABC transporter substrate-binding protein [Aneurinibacillus sp. Ricciae_BoGa-3]WCK53227.1 ABC transporter substrate-binding protein [Aneurinibacillus sp. Ricciae_BoGa-3]
MKKVVKWAVPVILAGSLAASGCGSASTSSGSKNDPIRIGMITALTGEYNLVGNYLLHGAEMAVQEINDKGGVNGRKLEIVKEDSAKENPTAVNAFNKMVNSDNVVAILGPDLSTQLFAVEPVINKAKIPVLIQGSNPKLTQDTPWYFRLRPNDSLAASSAAAFAVEKLKATKIGITHDTDEFGSGGAKIIEDSLKKAGITPVGVEAYNSSDKDLSAQLMNLKKKGAEVIVDWGHPQQSATLMKQNKELGLNLKIVGSPGMSMPATTKLAGDAVKDVYCIVDTVPSENPDPKVKEWVAKYQKAYNDLPDFHSASAYDGVYMLADAIKGSKDLSAQSLADALHKEKYHGMANDFDYSKGGEGAQQVVAVQLQDPTHMKLIDTIKAK